MLFVASIVPAFADELTPTLGDDSAYTLTEVSSDGDGVITEYEYDRDTNTLTPKYYELNLKDTEYGTGGKSKTIDVDVLGKNVPVTVKYDDSTTKTYTNIYTAPIKNTSTITIKDAIFENVQATSALVYNREATITSITSDFISNVVTPTSYLYGGCLIAHFSKSTSRYPESFSIGDIKGDFILNEATVNGLQGGGLIGIYSNYYNAYSVSSVSYTIGDITGNFILNKVNISSEIVGGGLVGSYSNSAHYVYSLASIGNIAGDFISNIVNFTTDKTSNFVYGGGLIGNYSNSTEHPTYPHSSTIGNITGNFISNIVNLSSKLCGGGLIGNYSIKSGSSIIGNLSGNLISNVVTVNGSIYGSGLIGNFSCSNYENLGSPTSKVGDITGDLISNVVTVNGSIYGGGLIGNYSCSSSTDTSISTIGNIKGDFISNIVNVSGDLLGGGLISGSYLSPGNSLIGDINSNFYNNVVNLTGTSKQGVYAGVIYSGSNNDAKINSISGTFVNNSVIKETGSATVSSGVIYNDRAITNGITNSIFKNNYVKIAEGTVYASVIRNSRELSINADNGATIFSGNYSQIGDGEKNYNAVYVDSFATLTLNATNNGIITFDDSITGSKGYTLNITGDSSSVVNIHNTISNANLNVSGVGKVDFVDNVTREYNLVSITSDENVKYTIDIDLVNRTSDKFITSSSSSGRITLDSLNIIDGNWEDLISSVSKIQVIKTKNDNLQLALSDDLASSFGTETKISSKETLRFDNVQADTKWNDTLNKYVDFKDVYGYLSLTKTDTTNDSIGVEITKVETGSRILDTIGDTLMLVNQANIATKSFNFDASSNVYNVTEDLGETAEGTLSINGVLSTTDVTDEATGVVSSVQETSTINFNNKSGFELNNSTKLNVNNTTLTNALGSSNGSVISASNSESEVNLKNTSLVNNISTGKGGAIYSKSDVNISADNAIVNISRNIDGDGNNAIYLDNADKTLALKSTNNALIKLDDKINGETGYKVSISGDDTSNVIINNNIDNANVTLGNTNIYLSKENLLNDSVSVTMDNTNLSVVNNSVGEMNVPTFNLVGTNNIKVDADLENKVMDRIIASNYNISDGAMLNVSGINIISPTTERKVSIPFADSQFANNVAYTGINPVAYSPIYKYKASYDVNEADGMGYFTFVRGASGDSNSYNPSVLAPSVAQQTGTYTTQLNTFNYAFQHADLFMNMPTMERIAYKNRNKYATSNVGVFSPLMTGEEMQGFWIKPYATFENVPLKNGPKVNSVSYGTLVGYDEPMTSLKHGWDRVFTYYLGYNGASQNFSGIDCYQNGGLLGATMTLYKGNFFTATTLSAGATVGESHTMYGTEFSTTMFAGIGNKTGYNIEFNQGKFIIQPSMLLAYTFLNTFDYKNAAGVQINSDPTSMIQIAPTVRFVVNTKTGWQPYLAVGMVWNILAHSNIKANGEELPDMYTKPYVQYGLGLQKVVKDRFTAFGQAMIYNGGRNGISLSAGVRYALGKENQKHSAGTPKIVKEIKPAMMDNSKNVKNTEITGNNTVQVTNKNVQKNDKKHFDFKLQQTSISIVR